MCVMYVVGCRCGVDGAYGLATESGPSQVANTHGRAGRQVGSYINIDTDKNTDLYM